MANAEVAEEEVAPKKGKMGLVVAIVLALLAGGGGFYAAISGLLPFGADSGAEEEAKEEEPLKVLRASSH